MGKRKYPMAELRDALSAAGFEEVETHIQTGNVRFRTALRSREKVRQALEKNNIPTVEAKLGQMPQNYIKIDEGKSKSMMRLMEMLDDHDDVQNVWTNFDMPEEMEND